MDTNVIGHYRTTTDAQGEWRLVREVDDILFRVYPSMFSLMSLTGGFTFDANGKRKEIQGKIEKDSSPDGNTFQKGFEWFEEDVISEEVEVLTGASDPNQTQITFVNPNNVRPDDTLYFPDTGERAYVISKNGNILTLRRNVGGTTYPIIDGATAWVYGNANIEHNQKRDILSKLSVHKWNYYQIFREDYGVSRTNQQIGVYAGKDLDNERSRHWFKLAQEVEKTAFLGLRALTTDVNGNEVRLTGGIRSTLATNVMGATQFGATLSEIEFTEVFCPALFTYTFSGEKYCFCGDAFVNCVNRWARNRLVVTQNDDMKRKYGINVTDIITAKGVIHVIPNYTVQMIMPGSAFFLELPLFKMKQLQKFTQYTGNDIMKNKATNLVDGTEEMVLGEIGFKLKGEAFHGVLEGITGPA